MKKNQPKKLATRVKINIVIFGVLAVIFATIPQVLIRTWFPNTDSDQPSYAGQFAYTLYDICPCSDGDDACQGYYACGSDKANLTYNLDNAPADLLASAKQAQYFDNMIESSRQSTMVIRMYILSDISYLMSFISLVAGVIYWNHNKAKA